MCSFIINSGLLNRESSRGPFRFIDKGGNFVVSIPVAPWRSSPDAYSEELCLDDAGITNYSKRKYSGEALRLVNLLSTVLT